MRKIKVVFCDIYGTILCQDDSGNEMPPRRGFTKFVESIKAAGIKLISTSDAELTNLNFDLIDTFQRRVPFGPEVFDKYYRLAMSPKDYSIPMADLAVAPEELLIIGNNKRNDLSHAPKEANKILIPTYQGIDNELDLCVYSRRKIDKMKNIVNFLN